MNNITDYINRLKTRYQQDPTIQDILVLAEMLQTQIDYIQQPHQDLVPSQRTTEIEATMDAEQLSYKREPVKATLEMVRINHPKA